MAQDLPLARRGDRRGVGRTFLHALALGAVWLALGGPRWALAQQGQGGGQQMNPYEAAQESGMEDAADEEMLTGEAPSSQFRRPGTGALGEQGPPPELTFTTRLSQTAVWVGDQFHYQVIVDHSPKIEFVVTNLNRDNINMEPLRVVDTTFSNSPLKNGNERLFVDLTLANFTTGVQQLQIPQWTLFYFRKEGAAAATTTSEGKAAESLTVPGPVIALRSTLPPDPPDLRDAVTVSGWARNRWVVWGVGWLALVVVLGGAGWESFHLVRYRRGRKGPDPRKAMAAIQDRWSQSVPGDFSDSNVVLEFYGRSYQDLKEYLGYLLETHTEGLTADDMKDEMVRLAANPDLAERSVKVLGICETARYGRNGKELVGDAARGVAHDMREIFQAGSRLM